MWVDLVGSWSGGNWPCGSWFRGSWSRGHESSHAFYRFFPKCQLPKCQLPECQLPKWQLPECQLPKCQLHWQIQWEVVIFGVDISWVDILRLTPFYHIGWFHSTWKKQFLWPPQGGRAPPRSWGQSWPTGQGENRTNTLMHMHTHICTHMDIHAHMCIHIQTQNGFSPLTGASQKGYDVIVGMLLQAGATVDLQSKVEDCYYDSTLFICHL